MCRKPGVETAMKGYTLSGNSRRLALHAAMVLIVLAVMILILSAHTFAAVSPEATGKVNASGGAHLRKSSTTSSGKVATLANNTTLTIYREVYKSKTSTAKSKIWYYVKASNGKTGYIRADLVDNIDYSMVSGTINSKVNIRKGPGTKMKKAGTLKKGTRVTIYLDSRPVSSTKGRNKVWYRIYHNGKFSFVCSASVNAGGVISTASPVKSTSNSGSGSTAKLTQSQVSQVVNATSGAINKMSNAQFETYLTRQGFPEDYKKSLRALHAQHPNWVFVAYKTGLKWKDVLNKESAKNVSLVHKSYPSSYRSSSYRSQVEPGWYNANSIVVAYYMDPRNFLNQDRIYMFENLAYQSEYQTTNVVNKIISGTKLASYGFNANVFMSAGKAYKISPVFLAARARQETGGNSPSVNGSKSGGVKIYNPFNIGAYGSNPAAKGLAYARKMGWTTPAKSVNGGAKYLASGYINKKQNTIYFQRFNVANGLRNAGTHQYMTNIMAPYSESHITKNSYSKLGITGEALGFIIPVYNNMPNKTKLP